jgi:hypothetical protein
VQEVFMISSFMSAAAARLLLRARSSKRHGNLKHLVMRRIFNREDLPPKLLYFREMASLARSVLAVCALVAAAVAVSAAVPSGSKMLARSEFHWDNDGWKGYSKRRVVRVDVDMGQVWFTRVAQIVFVISGA